MLAIEVSAGIGAFIVSAAAAAGVPRAELEKRTGFTLSWAEDPDARIPLEMETALWEEAARAARDSAFGLHAAEGLRPGVFDVLDYVVRAAPTVRASWERLARYNRLVHDAAVFAISEGQGGVVRIEHTLSRPALAQSRHAAEFTMASLVVVGAQMSGAPLAPTAVELRHAPPDAAARAEHLRLFGVAPRYGRAVNALELPGAAAARPVPSADPLLSRIVVRHAEALLVERPAAAETAAGKVRRILTGLLGDDETGASLAAVSARLHMSERSLQRRLADEGVSLSYMGARREGLDVETRVVKHFPLSIGSAGRTLVLSRGRRLLGQNLRRSGRLTGTRWVNMVVGRPTPPARRPGNATGRRPALGLRRRCTENGRAS